MNEFFDNLIGADVNLAALLAYAVWAYGGLGYSLYTDFVSSGENLKQFNPSYYWGQNKWRVIQSIIAIPIGLIFTQDLLGIELNSFSALLLGFNIDKLLETIKDRKKRKIQSSANNESAAS